MTVIINQRPPVVIINTKVPFIINTRGPAGPMGPSAVTEGIGSPEGVETAGIGALYVNKNGGVNTTLYVKTSGTGNTGWTAK